MRFKTIVAIILAFILVIFSLQNTELVEIEFLIWPLKIQVVMLIIGTFALGVLVGILVSLRKKKKTIVEEKVIEKKVIEKHAVVDHAKVKK